MSPSELTSKPLNLQNLPQAPHRGSEPCAIGSKHRASGSEPRAVAPKPALVAPNPTLVVPNPAPVASNSTKWPQCLVIFFFMAFPCLTEPLRRVWRVKLANLGGSEVSLAGLMAAEPCQPRCAAVNWIPTKNILMTFLFVLCSSNFVYFLNVNIR